MLQAYIKSALGRAHYEILEDDRPALADSLGWNEVNAELRVEGLRDSPEHPDGVPFVVSIFEPGDHRLASTRRLAAS